MKILNLAILMSVISGPFAYASGEFALDVQCVGEMTMGAGGWATATFKPFQIKSGEMKVVGTLIGDDHQSPITLGLVKYSERVDENGAKDDVYKVILSRNQDYENTYFTKTYAVRGTPTGMVEIYVSQADGTVGSVPEKVEMKYKLFEKRTVLKDRLFQDTSFSCSLALSTQ